MLNKEVLPQSMMPPKDADGNSNSEDLDLGLQCLSRHICLKKDEPHCEKTGLQGFRPGPTQTCLYSYRRWLEA